MHMILSCPMVSFLYCIVLGKNIKTLTFLFLHEREFKIFYRLCVLLFSLLKMKFGIAVWTQKFWDIFLCFSILRRAKRKPSWRSKCWLTISTWYDVTWKHSIVYLQQVFIPCHNNNMSKIPHWITAFANNLHYHSRRLDELWPSNNIVQSGDGVSA